jgi:hypothetical protein
VRANLGKSLAGQLRSQDFVEQLEVEAFSIRSCLPLSKSVMAEASSLNHYHDDKPNPRLERTSYIHLTINTGSRRYNRTGPIS